MDRSKRSFFGIFFETGLYRVCILLLMCVVMSFISANFFKIGNLINIARQASVLLILASCATGCILTHGIDNSLGGVMSLCGCACGYFLNHNYSIVASILLAVVIGAAFGCINGFLIAIVKIPPFVSTYGVSYIANGLALILMGSDIFCSFPKAFRNLSTGNLGAFPLLVIWALLVTALMYVALQRSNFGKKVYSVGANYTTAKYSGISTVSTLFVVYILSACGAALAGVLQAARQSAAQAGMGDTFQMLAIASIVMGGTSMAGGEGNVLGGILGALILTLIVNAMNLLGVPSLAQSLITGAVIILAVLMDVQMKRIQYSRPQEKA
ncbi:MAG: ABC transporter permease [Candidatus Limiplasma sp.]|nr:ABC transporter permease [Candidatus Limiplasma sp.]